MFYMAYTYSKACDENDFSSKYNQSDVPVGRRFNVAYSSTLKQVYNGALPNSSVALRILWWRFL